MHRQGSPVESRQDSNTGNAGKPISLFLQKMYDIVQDTRNASLIKWDEPEGKSFTILDEKRFIEENIPLHFKHKNFNSFVRQLNMYDFHKVKTYMQPTISFKHTYFRRNQRHLLAKIFRKSNKGHPYHPVRCSTRMSIEPKSPIKQQESFEHSDLI